MNSLLVRWLVSAIALYITSLLAQQLHLGIHVKNAVAALLAAAALGIINALIRPLLVLLTLPLNCMTVGLFTFVINALMFWLAGQLVPGFDVKGVVAPLFGSIVMGIIAGLANSLISSKE